jgi:signal transduction histidine kinase
MAITEDGRERERRSVPGTRAPWRTAARDAPHAGVETRRRADRAFVAAFVALLIGLAAILVVVAASLQPPLRELSRLERDEAYAASVATRLHEHLASLRQHVVAAVRGGTALAAQTSSDFRALSATASELVPLAGSGVERTGVERLRTALDSCAAISARIEASLAAGDLTGAHSELARFLEQSLDASQATDDIVQYNVQQVVASAHRVHRGMIWALAAISVLSALVVASALVIIRVARSAVTRHATLLETLASETSAFAARTAHELRSPLQTLWLSLSSLRSEPSQGALERAERAARRLSETIDDILQFAQSGARPPPDARAEVAGAVAEALQDVEPSAAQAHVALKAEVPAGLLVKMTPGHLRIVVGNLVSNAVKYGAEVPHARVDVAASAVSEAVDIVVRDTGPGIPPDAVPHMFEPFFRASARPGGYGLGLATVKRLVDAYGGSVDVKSAVGQGTRVAVHLPIASAAEPGSARTRQ